MRDERFASLRQTERTWAVGAIHGEVARLKALHGRLAERLRRGDNLVYMGNILGRGGAVGETVNEILAFRRAFLARPGVFAADLAYLRGGQEEMWHKLLQLQFAPNPGEVLRWMLDQGVGPTLQAYGGDAKKGLMATRAGALAVTGWTNGLRAAMRTRDGHVALTSALRRAAFIADHSLLFVHAGIDPSRPLFQQADSFWWGGREFDRLAAPYGTFTRIVRGYDPAHRGVAIGPLTATLDGGCGFGGPLMAGCIHASGEVGELIEA